MDEKPAKIVIRPPDLPAEHGFSGEYDTFNLSPFGTRLTSFLSRVEMPITVLIDGDWGTGKSTFLRQWSTEYPGTAIVLDAFANDHGDDAFVFLSAAIASVDLGDEDFAVTRRSFLERAKEFGAKIAPVGVNAGIRMATAGALDSDSLEDIGEAASDLFSDGGKRFAQLAESNIEARFARAMSHESTLSKFRDSLRNLSEKISGRTDDGYPLVVAIDELDRCRPNFAISILEIIKHTFSVPDLCFMLVGNFEQLEAAVCGLYGEKIDSAVYLRKFYDLRLFLPRKVDEGPGSSEKYVQYLYSHMKIRSDSQEYDRQLIYWMQYFAKTKPLSLRDLERIAVHWALFVASSDKRFFRKASIVAPLLVMRVISPALFDKARHEQLLWSEARGFLEFDQKNMQSAETAAEHWWRFFTEEELAEEEWVQRIYNTVAPDFSDPDNRPGILAWVANMLDTFVR